MDLDDKILMKILRSREGTAILVTQARQIDCTRRAR